MAIVLLISTCSPRASAWQLGLVSGQSANSSGVRASQEIHGGVPTGWFGAVTGFTDNGGGWHTMEVISPNPTQIQFEYPGGSYHACNVALDTYYDIEILYTNGAWLYKVLTPTSCNSLLFYTSSGKVNSGASLDMMESTDYNANDFTNVKAAAYFNPTLEYYSGGWRLSQSAVSYAYDNNPKSVGLYTFCSSGTGHTVAAVYYSSQYAPPPPSGGLDFLLELI